MNEIGRSKWPSIATVIAARHAVTRALPTDCGFLTMGHGHDRQQVDSMLDLVDEANRCELKNATQERRNDPPDAIAHPPAGGAGRRRTEQGDAGTVVNAVAIAELVRQVTVSNEIDASVAPTRKSWNG